ncbi:MAG: NAD(P)/FAD-dependent oxidoreductase [Rhodanobacteraceae bacterium]
MPVDNLPGEWEVVVVGSGVAGALSALHLARLGLRVLLVEKAAWPRDKVCGGCLNAAALRALTNAGIDVSGGRVYARMRLACGRRAAELPLPAGLAMSRRRLDALLVEHAVRAGARFVSGTRASLGKATLHHREVALRQGSRQRFVSARVVLDCGGLASRLLPGIDWRVARAARIGVGGTLRDIPSAYRAGTIHMACTQRGYVGLVRAEDGTANIAAALDPAWCGSMGGPARAIADILDAAGFPSIENLRGVDWHGTPHLTRSRRALGAERVLILGDAAGYVEPFTGEGMAWALMDAAMAASLAREAVTRWDDAVVARWSALHARNVRARQRVCRGMARLLRHPGLLAAALPIVGAMPALISPLSAWLNRNFRPPAAVPK